MNITRLRLYCCLLSGIALAAATGCSTVSYRTIQNRFETAVRNDNAQATMPFTDSTIPYRQIASDLTTHFIARLDPRLRPNAWTLRAVSHWRAGDFGPAVYSALEGQAEIARQIQRSPLLEHGRDSILLTMLPGLVEDSRLRQRFSEHGAPDVAAHYDAYDAGFRAAVRALAEARSKVATPTPSEVVAYWNFQCWRVLQNWSFVLSHLPIETASDAYRETDTFLSLALAEAGLSGAADLHSAITAAEGALPASHPYRQLVDLEKSR